VDDVVVIIVDSKEENKFFILIDKLIYLNNIESSAYAFASDALYKSF
jgi:hypothetical protein